MAEIKLFIASSQRLFRESLVHAISKGYGITVVGETDNGYSTINQVIELQPDIVVLETNLPDQNGVETARQILTRNQNIKIIALSKVAVPHYVWRMLETGISGYILQSSPLKEFINTVYSVAKGEIYLSPQVAGMVVKTLSDKEAQEITPSVLSSREREVLQLIAEGYKPSQIADKLFISPKTVQIHQANLKKKLKLSSTAELTKYAVVKGMTPLETFIRKGTENS
ncbi:MAG: response regulator transcription factor [Desulfobacterales bacterium]|nr:response regulator transcription factor [Desulfobacterales bacterium]